MRRLLLASALCVELAACGASSQQDRQAEREGALERGSTPAVQKTSEARQETLPAPEESGVVLEAHHRRWVSGDVEGAKRLLRAALSNMRLSAAARARAALELADILELQGERRDALSFFELARRSAPRRSDLRAEAEKRRAAILSKTPLADVPGPAPGAARLSPGTRGAGLFRRAERLLVAFYRLALRPRIETIDRARAAKRQALRRAVAAYERVVKIGGEEAALAARCRIGSMYQHMAEALAFDRPRELLPAAARRLGRELREESAANLRKALAAYRAALKMQPREGGQAWVKVARREVRVLAGLLEPLAGK